MRSSLFAASAPLAAVRRGVAGAVFALVGLASLAATEGTASAAVVVFAPPTPRVEIMPPVPSAHVVWAPGYWGYRPSVGYAWYGGRYIHARPGYAWAGPRWVGAGHAWHFVPGHWRR
jgi:hypothetical protein